MQADFNQWEQIYFTARGLVIQYGFQFLVSIMLLVVGLWIGSRMAKSLEKLLIARHIDATLSKFLANLAKGAFAVLVTVVVLNQMGFAIAPLVAAIGAMAFGASFAVQGLLSNFGAGLAIIITRPYKISDTIETRGTAGQVKEIRLGQTILETEDGEEVSIPNHMILGQVLVNSGLARLVDACVGVAYGSNIAQVKSLILEALNSIAEISQSPGPKIGLDNLADSALEIRVRFWVPTKSYFQMRFAAMEAIYLALQKGNVEIPFPQRVLHTASLADKAVS